MASEHVNPALRFSIVVPFHNEEENVTELYDRLKHVMETTGETFEIDIIYGAGQAPFQAVMAVALG